MKRLFPVVFIIIAVLLCSNAWAKPVFGVKAGLNLANATEDPEDLSNKIKLGLMFGGVGDFSLSQSNTTTLRLELLYVQKGWKESGLATFYSLQDGYYMANADITYSVDELVIAPFLVLRFPSEGVTPFIQGGPELGFNLGAKYKVDSQGQSESSDFPNWSSTNFGINIGGGIALPAGDGEVVFDARYNLGLVNLYTGSADYSVKTNGIQFLVGYNFRVLGK
jgi:hypothetical protein